MKPLFLEKMDEALCTNQHVILDFNTTDRFFWPEWELGPLNLTFFLGRYFTEKGYRVAEYAPANGLKELNIDSQKEEPKKPLANTVDDPVAALQKIGSLLRKRKEKWIILIHYCEHLAPRESMGVSASSVPGQVKILELLHRFSFDDAITTGSSRVVLITYGAMPAELISRAHGYRTIRVDLPCMEERLCFIRFLDGLSDNPRFGKLEKGLKPEDFAAITGGMPLIGIESLYLTSEFKKHPITREQVREVKAESLAQLAQDLLEVSEPEVGFSDVAGLKSPISFLRKLIKQARFGRCGMPQTLLFQGVPGCGKTYLAQAMAHELDWPLVQFRSVRGPYVGQSEQQLELVITIVEQLQPVALLFDEIDQLIGQRGTGASGDSGTSERMLARIFNWLGSMEHRGKILFIGTSNRPDILDAALLDRFRVSIPILHPTNEDLEELIPLTLERFKRQLEKRFSVKKAAGTLAELRPSGRSLQEIIVHAGIIADDTRKPGTPITGSHLMQAAQDYLPIENPLEMEFISLTALSMCSANSFLPWMNGGQLREGSVIPDEYISEGIVDKNTGRIDRVKLHQKLGELSHARQYSKAMR